ncbi:MAG: hypothetical protein ABEK01_03410 [Candidatus Nanohaloarchaea archaeon]
MEKTDIAIGVSVLAIIVSLGATYFVSSQGASPGDAVNQTEVRQIAKNLDEKQPNREREEMNALALKVVRRLSEEVPRGTAESSVASQCSRIGVDPMELREEDLDELVQGLEISMRGLDISEEVFSDIRHLSEG